jgi:hypothetical protein
MVWQAFLQAGLSIGGGIFGASSANSQARDQRQAMERQQLDSYLSQMDDWQFNNAVNQLNHDFAVNSAQLSFDIERAVALQNWESSKALEQARYIYASTTAEMEWQSQSANQQRDYDITQLLQAADQRAQMRVFEASERTYSENTRLISKAASQAYAFEKERLKYERAGIKLETRSARTQFQGQSKEARNQAKQVEARYRSELRQAGFSGEALQMEVNQKMKEFTGKQDAATREASAESAQVAASGKTGATATRMMQDPFSRSDVMIGAMGVELGFFGTEKQVEMLKLAEATGLAGQMADLDRERIYNNLDTSARMTNLTLEGLNLQERQAIFQSNNQLADTKLQAQSQLNEAKSNRELRPMQPVKLPEPLPIVKSLIPQPFFAPRPMQATPGLQPLLPSRPMAPPQPRMGSAVPRMSSGAGGILASSIFQGAASFANAFTKFQAPNAGNIQSMNSGSTIGSGIFQGQ